MTTDIIGTIIGGCRIESQLGAGGMGTVYKAHHIALDIPVAVKLLTNVSEVPDAAVRFVREAQIAARLKHKNIAAVLNVGEEGGRHYIVMEYIQGENLKSVVDRRGKLPEGEVTSIALAILDALCKAHESGIVHRDIKPENILIEDNGTVRLIDLGLARSGTISALTQPNTVLGSPYYVAPEQAENPGAADCRADIYSLGCTLYHLLSGSIPFPGTTIIEVLMNHINKPVPRLHQVTPEVSKKFADIIAKMMDKAPGKRYQTPMEAYNAIDAVKAMVEAVSSPKLTVKAAKKRERRIVVTASLFLIAVVVFFALRWGRTLFDDHVVTLKDQTKLALGVERAADDSAATISNDTALSPDKKAASNKALPHKNKPVAKKTLKKAPPVPSEGTPPQGADERTDQVLAAVKIGDTETLSRLLREGKSPNGKPGVSSTPLHEAVRRGLGEDARLLLSSGARPNMKDHKGNTPLHYALREDATYLAEILLNYGADPNTPDGQGTTPLEIAKSVSSSMEQLVRSRGGR